MFFIYRISLAVFIVTIPSFGFVNFANAEDAVSQSVLNAILDSTNDVTLWDTSNGIVGTAEAVVKHQIAVQALKNGSPTIGSNADPSLGTSVSSSQGSNTDASQGFNAAPTQDNSSSSSENGWGAEKEITVIVTEKIPWAVCTCIAEGSSATEDAAGNYFPGTGEEACGSPDTRKYQCVVWKWMWAFQMLIGAITKWFIYLTMLFWVLALVWAGILWAWGSESEEYTKKAKGWAVNIIIGLGLLFTFRYILWFLAPWIFM